MLERALLEIRAQYPQARWIVSISGERNLTAGSYEGKNGLPFVLLRELLDAGNENPREVWFEGEDEAFIACAHPFLKTAVALGFSPPVSPGVARRLSRGLLGELSGRTGRIILQSVPSEHEFERVKSIARARMEPILGVWLSDIVIHNLLNEVVGTQPVDVEKLRKFEFSIKRMGWGGRT